MSTTRRRRIRAHRDELREQHVSRRREVDARVARIQGFDDALLKVMAWAIAVLIAVAIVTAVA